MWAHGRYRHGWRRCPHRGCQDRRAGPARNPCRGSDRRPGRSTLHLGPIGTGRTGCNTGNPADPQATVQGGLPAGRRTGRQHRPDACRGSAWCDGRRPRRPTGRQRTRRSGRRRSGPRRPGRQGWIQPGNPGCEGRRQVRRGQSHGAPQRRWGRPGCWGRGRRLRGR